MECPCGKEWKPTQEQLSLVLQASKERGFNPKRSPAVLCDADLRYRDLGGAELYEADLRGALLSNANLEGAYLNGADLRHAELFSAHMDRAVLEEANLQGADLSHASLKNASFDRAELRNANLSHADLAGAFLEEAVLEDAKLLMSNLSRANLDYANLKEVYGEKINFRGARLRGADLEGANLERSQLQNADFFMANLTEVDLYLANLEGARLAGANLTQSNFAPSSAPPDGHLAGIQGLRSVVFPPGQQSGLVQLRVLLENGGLRILEREATFAIERNKSLHDRRSSNWSRKIIGAIRLVSLEWTTGYGLAPQRAIYLLILLAVVMALIYAIPIMGLGTKRTGRDGIIRVWPADRVEAISGGFAPAGKEKMVLLTSKGPAILGWATYFSLLSAFHFGWRDLNIGTWLTRVQPSEFGLRGRGWVRVASGLQSLASLYLIAVWALTYFGRPFQ